MRWRSGAVMPGALEDRLRAERALVATRAVLATVALAAVYLDPTEPSVWPGTAYALLTLYAGFAIALAVAFRGLALRELRASPAVHAVDVAFAGAITFLTQGPSSPFFVFFTFALVSAAARWGMRATLVTGAAAVGVFAAQVSAGWLAGGPDTLDVTRVVTRGGYLLVLTAMLGYLFGQEHELRAERATLSRVVSEVAAAGSMSDAVRLLLCECLPHFGARAAALVLQGADGARPLAWHAARDDARGVVVSREDLSPVEAAAWLGAVPAGAMVWHGWRDGASTRVRGLGPDEARAWSPEPGSVSVAQLLELCRADAVLVTETGAPGDWRGRLVLVDPTRAAEDQLVFARTLATHVAPALHNRYLVRRLRSRVGAMERARLARDLHDGLVQSLIGVEMDVEALRQGRPDAGGADTRLGAIRDQLRQCVGEVRDLLWQLRREPATADEVVRHVSELAHRLRREHGLDVRLSGGDHAEWTPRTCAHVARIVQEALTNVRRHSGATAAAVTMEATADGFRAVVEDNGRGFPFEGRASLEQLEAGRVGPAQIIERVRALGGRLVVDSRPGAGARIEVEWPRRPSGSRTAHAGADR